MKETQHSGVLGRVHLPSPGPSIAEKIVILVPWRGGEDRREWLWDVCRPWLERFGWPIFCGDSVGPWARAGAVNAAERAAEAAGGWDLALVADTDTIPDPGSILRAMDWIRSTGGAARPHAERWMLTREGSLIAAQMGPSAIKPEHLGKQFAGGGLLCLTHAAWDAVEGFDETFIGWGYEDSAMTMALMRESTWDRLPGQAWHLWHPAEQNKPRRDSVNRYRALLKENHDVIENWSRNKGLRAPAEVI